MGRGLRRGARALPGAVSGAASGGLAVPRAPGGRARPRLSGFESGFRYPGRVRFAAGYKNRVWRGQRSPRREWVVMGYEIRDGREREVRSLTRRQARATNSPGSAPPARPAHAAPGPPARPARGGPTPTAQRSSPSAPDTAPAAPRTRATPRRPPDRAPGTDRARARRPARARRRARRRSPDRAQRRAQVEPARGAARARPPGSGAGWRRRRRSLRAAPQPIETWSSCIALVGSVSTLAGTARRRFSATIAACVYWAIIMPELTPASAARNGGSPCERVASSSRSVRRSAIAPTSAAAMARKSQA